MYEQGIYKYLLNYMEGTLPGVTVFDTSLEPLSTMRGNAAIRKTVLLFRDSGSNLLSRR